MANAVPSTPCVVASDVEGEQAERDRQEASADERDDLGRKKAPVGVMRENLEHTDLRETW